MYVCMYVFIKVASSRVGSHQVGPDRIKSGLIVSRSVPPPPPFFLCERASRWVMKDGDEQKGWFTVYMFNDNQTSDIHPFSSLELVQEAAMRGLGDVVGEEV